MSILGIVVLYPVVFTHRSCVACLCVMTRTSASQLHLRVAAVTLAQTLARLDRSLLIASLPASSRPNCMTNVCRRHLAEPMDRSVCTPQNMQNDGSTRDISKLMKLVRIGSSDGNA